MQAELEALESSNTWILSVLHVEKKAIAYKLIFRIKYNIDGIMDKYKSRLVAKGYNQGLTIMTVFLLLLN